MQLNLFRTGFVGLFLCVALPALAQCVQLFSRYDTLIIGEPGSGYTLTASSQLPFTALTDVTWLSLTKSGSSITITSAQSNDTYSERIGRITISQDGSCRETLTVVQPGKTCIRGIDGTQGRKFWAAFSENMYLNSQSQLTTNLVFTSLTAASGTITNPNTTYTATFTMPAKGIHTVSIPEVQAYNTVGETVSNKAIYIETSADVSVYGVNFQEMTSDAAVILPVEALGDEYYSLSFNGNEGRSSTDRTPEEFLIVATENNTLVTIVPKNRTGGGKAAGDPFVIRLHKGQSYLIKSDINGSVDSESNYVSITGSYIKSNKLIAVFAGHKRAHVGCNGNNNRDHLYEQLLPIRLWGTQYLVVPTNVPADNPSDLYRVLAAHDNTQFSINGATTYTLNRGEYRDFHIAQYSTAFIEADKALSVALFAKSIDCTNNNSSEKIGDPFMLVLNPVQNMTRELTFSPLPSSNISEHYVNITVKKQSKDLTYLVNEQTGQRVSISFTDIPGRDYAYAKVAIVEAAYSLKNDTGFTAYAYGAGRADSYGYLVGARFNHLQEPDMVRDTSYCVDETPQSLSVFDGNDLLWYTTNDFEQEAGSPIAPVFTTDHPATYTYYVSYLKECSESPRKKVTIIVEYPPANPVVSTLYAQSSASFCYGEKDTLMLQSSGAEIFEWYKDNQRIDDASGTTLTVTESGTYHAKVASAHRCYAVSPSNLFEVTAHELPVAPNCQNTAVCKADTIPSLPVAASAHDLIWYNENSEQISAPVLQTSTVGTTTYYITQQSRITHCEGQASTWMYTVNDLPDVTISGTPYFCTNSYTELTASGAMDYLWDTGATSASISINAVGTYSVTGTDHNGCKNTAQITISEKPLPFVTANNDTMVCYERDVTLGTQQHTGDLSWNSPLSVKVTELQTYTVTASNECGTTSDEMTVDIFAPVRFTVQNPLPPYNYRRFYEQALSFENAEPPVYLRWLGSLPEGMTITPNGILRGTPMVTGYNFNSHRFTLFLEDVHGCAVSQEFLLPPLFYAPNAIIRDGGENSHFLPDFDLEIYNRQGVLLHKGKGWLGTSGSSQVPRGTYFYKVNVMQDGEQHQHMGYVTVLQ